jgi:hypothetical protein
MKGANEWIAWSLIVLGILMVLPLLGVTLGPWNNWIMPILMVIVGIKLLPAKGKK